MTGLIWFVQIVHYPLFTGVGGDRFTSYAQQHARRTSWVVAAPMLLELTTAILLLVRSLRPAFLPQSSALAALLLLVMIWISTGLVQVPLHNRLALGFDARSARLLVATNWFRTVLWTARTGLLLYVTLQALRSADRHRT